ncbi:MAG: hypothetical protein H8E27_08000 [Verrucomicrobia subdivision 3 bacterium]|nr:hypothetical protein [Limisphaerales bacterium]
MLRLIGLLSILVTLGFAPQLSAQLFGPGVLRTGPGMADRTIEIKLPARPGAQAATVLITPPAQSMQQIQQIQQIQPQLVAPVPYMPGYFPQPNYFGMPRGLPMHTMAMTPGAQYAWPMYVQPTAGSVIIITPPRVNAAYPARALFGR